MKKNKVGRLFTAIVLALAPVLLLADLAHASATVISTPGGDDSSYQIPLSEPVIFFGQEYSSIYATTNAVITFGAADGTFWDFPMTPSISLGSQDWVAFSGRSGEQFVISYTEDAFQVDMIARPFGAPISTPVSRLVLTGIIKSDRTIDFSYYLENVDPYPNLRFGVRTPDGQVLSLEQANFQESVAPPSEDGEIMAPPTESDTITESEQVTESDTVSQEVTESPSVSEEATESSTVSEETSESTTVSEEATESPTVSEDISESPSTSPQYPGLPAIWDYSVNEGWTLEATAPEGKVFASAVARYESQTSECGIDVSEIVLSVFAGTSSASISATNDVFTDPCPGEYKRLIVAFGYADIESSSPDISESPSVSPEPVPAPEPEPSPSPAPAPQPVAPAPVAPSPEPQPTIPEPTEPEPQPEPTPEETIEPEDAPEPAPEPSPEPVVIPQPQPTATPTQTPVPTPSPSLPEPTPTPIVTPEPSPEPRPTPIPAPVPTTPQEVTSDTPISDVISVIENVVPTSLTEEQAAVLVEIALATFETAEPGSEEYQQALDLLLIAAQQDDIVLDEAIAAIPLIGNVAGAAVDVLNALGNAGADMSPKVREQSEKVVIASVIVANIAITATAATSAATAAARRP
jgi:hypothetical protein